MTISLTFLVALATMCLVHGQKIYEETFLSPLVTLHPGQIANTDPVTFPHLDWPQKPIAVRYFDSEVVDEDGNAVALYDLYIHHYLIYVNLGKFSAGWCNLPSVWGIGAEMRGTIYEYPEPYAIVFDGTENITANLHFIRTDTVSVEDHQKCIECHCSDGTPSNPHGSISCCGDQTFCWGMQNTTEDPKNYYLKYTFKYTDITDDVKPLTEFMYDVMAEENFDCYIEYQVSNESVADGKVCFCLIVALACFSVCLFFKLWFENCVVSFFFWRTFPQSIKVYFFLLLFCYCCC